VSLLVNLENEISNHSYYFVHVFLGFPTHYKRQLTKTGIILVMEMRDFSSLPGVAQPKSTGAMDEHARAEQNRESNTSFADPNKNVMQIGVTSGMKVADFGAGSGAYTLALAPLVGAGGRVYAVEVQQDLLKKIKNTTDAQGHRNVDVIWGDFERPNGSKLADGCVDMVIISNTLFQLEDKRGALLEANRVIHPGGQLVVIDWSESFGGMGPQKNDVVTKKSAKELCVDAGFVFSKEFEAGSHHYGLICQKPAQKSDKEKMI
jgi:ubiquinone/menaquinone biosynthesis C-methylase UbiE